MPSPFPGMDPYLEGYLWPDVHHRLATQISRQLAPRLRPRYVARIEVRVVRDETPEAEIGIMYPDVEVVTARGDVPMPSPTTTSGSSVAEVTPPLLEVPLPEINVRLKSVEIRDAAQNQLVTTIEILSPVNKREPGLSEYRAKRQRLREAGVHLIELDLLRRGARPFTHPRLPETAYLVTLIRAEKYLASLWPLTLKDELPVVPVPLRAPDPDVPLDLGLALREIYEEAAYDLSINYDEPPPPPPLAEDEATWIRQLLTKTGEGHC
jgi:hypothetical protein